ncbi:MAG: serine/threonine protein kinase [Planctomycetota bacterium]|nr:MAG: serine/threonine protein kinase [Planctomycetota bacterium]
MSITVTCSCGARFDVPESYAGRKGKCTTCGAPMQVPSPSGSAPPPTTAPKSLGEYTLGARLGGPESTVYLATSPSRGQVALKVLPKEVVEASPEAGQRFLRGARAMFGIDHPNLVRYLDAGEELGTFYLVMDCVRARTLREVLDARGGRLGEPEVLAYGIGVARALACLEDRGLVHRNVQPAHVLVGEGGLVKLCGMGLLRAQDTAQDVQVTAMGVAIGTPEYMSPEQALATGELDARSDLFSLGLTLYEMLTGAPPFADKVPSRVVARLAREEAPPVQERNPAVSQALAAVLSKLLRREPAERYPSAHDLVTDLESIRGGNLTKGLPPTLAGKATSTRPPAQDTDPRVRTLTYAVAGLAALVLLLLVVVIALALR